jgi:hypothetical protein
VCFSIQDGGSSVSADRSIQCWSDLVSIMSMVKKAIPDSGANSERVCSSTYLSPVDRFICNFKHGE